VSNSDDDLCLVQPTSARFMVGCQTFQKWIYGGRHYFGCCFVLFSLLFTTVFLRFTSSDLGPVEMTSAPVFTTCGDTSSVGGVSPCSGSAEWLPYGTDRLWDLCVRTFAYGKRLFNCFVSLSLLDAFMQPSGTAAKAGDNVMARLQVTCRGPRNICFI
jgi:hypothetical protein